MREIAGTEDPFQVHMSSITYLQQCKDTLGNFSEDPSHFTSDLKTPTLAFDMSWRDVYIILTTSFPPGKKQQIRG